MGLAEPLPEETVGRRHAIVRRQEHHVHRQRLEHVVEPLELGRERLLRAPALRDVAGRGEDADHLPRSSR